MKVRYGALSGMKVTKLTLILAGILALLLQWSCSKNNVTGTSVPTFAAISGSVNSSLTATPVTGATVILSYGAVRDTAYTRADGSFSLPPIEISSDTSGVTVTLTVSATGFKTRTYSNVSVKSDLSLPITLDIDPAYYAVVVGIVRDSTTTYPLRDAAVSISLPGAVDTATTLQNGSFVIYVNLEGLTSLQTTVTVSKLGFKTYRSTLLMRAGTDSVGTILLPVDQGATIAHIVGTVTDSRTGSPIPSVTVVLSSSVASDSTKTLGDGTFRFDPNLKGQPSAPMTLTFRQNGYNETSLNFTANSGETVTQNVVLTSNWNYAIVTGTVRDSSTMLPLSGAKVIVALTGGTSSSTKFLSKYKSHSHSVSSIILDSTTTFVDGSFSLSINLVDLDSLAATITVSEPGYKVLQFVRTFPKGSTSLGNVLIKIDNGLTTAHITGNVRDRNSLLPISGVAVYLTTPIKADSAFTSNSGNFVFDLNLQGLSSINGTMLFRLNSYNDTLVNFTVAAGQTFDQNIALSAKPTVVGGDSSTARGVARSIALVNVSRQEISVHGVGKNETSVLVWQVLDSLGFPIDINHRDTVVFIPTGTPITQGGAYVTPTSSLTDGSGDVSTTVNSGTAAGTIQLTARLTLSSGAIVESSPVLITVDGGLPDQAHFELNSNLPHAANFAGYDWSEVTQAFTVQAGDKYANPVAPNTAIYFSSTAGIITAAGQTDVTGHADATLYSGFPLPAISPTVLSSFSGIPAASFGSGTGYAFVKAFSQGENNVIVADSALICLSASAGPILFNDSLSIAPVMLSNSVGFVAIPVHIADRFGNPLEEGTTISSTVTVTPPPPNSGITWNIQSGGLPSDDGGAGLGDYLVRGPGSTDFTVVVTASAYPASVLATNPVSFTVKVKVTGRNTGGGTISNSFSGQLVP